jgi:hypothetical protein
MIPWLLFASLIAAQESAFEPVASVTEIMQAFIIPSSNEVFNVGIEFPETEDGWKAIETQALILAESGNLLLLPERAAGRDGWIEAARAMTGAARKSLEAARARDTTENTWFDLSDQILESCSTCHNDYWIVN